tara:strand:- start:463710 stop:463880 length:171 start_codon:yes stop_codon:yes gene_type:complete
MSDETPTMEIKTVSKDELIEILVRENGCDLDDAKSQVALISPKGLIVKGIRYTVGS